MTVVGRLKERINHANLYVVTGVNKLTGEREAVSMPLDYTAACRMRDRYARQQHRGSAWKMLKVESAVKEGSLFSR